MQTPKCDEIYGREIFYSREVVPLKSPAPPQEYLPILFPLHPPPLKKRKFGHPCPHNIHTPARATRSKIVRETTGVDLVDSHLQSTSGSRGGGGWSTLSLYVK